jgi:hypothetical protein
MQPTLERVSINALQKFNPIERRFLWHVTRACQGVLFDSLETVKRLMGRQRPDAEDGDPDRPQYDGACHEESLRNRPKGDRRVLGERATEI